MKISSRFSDLKFFIHSKRPETLDPSEAPLFFVSIQKAIIRTLFPNLY
jgi:hypothetical protein